MPMETNVLLNQLRDYVIANGARAAPGASHSILARFESYYNVQLPDDIRDYFLLMNGSDGSPSYGIMRFWSIEEVKTVAEEISRTPPKAAVIQAQYGKPFPGAEHYFVFADVLYEIQLYAIRLSPPGAGLGEIILLDGSPPLKMANSFSH